MSVSAQAGSITLTGPTTNAGTYSPSSLATFGTANPGTVVNNGGLTGISLWGLLGGANAGSNPAVFGAITTTTPAGSNSKNAILRYYVLATGTTGAQSVISAGQIDTMFGNPVNPPFVAYQNTGGALLTTPQLVWPGGPSGSSISSLASLQLMGYPAAVTGPGGISTSFPLSGNVKQPGSYTATTLQSNFTPAQVTVSGDTYTGVPLLTFLNTTAPSINTQIVVGQGTDGYEVLYSLSEFANLTNIIAYAATGSDFPADGVARTILPTDNAKGRYISNLSNLFVLNAAVGASPTATHDFNSDGFSDILWRDTAGDVGMWLVNGSQLLQTATFNALPTTWSVVGQRDFDDDGKSDILWRDTSGNVGVWLMNGTSIGSSTVLGNVATTWSVAGTGDFNGDGYADILWRNSNGTVGIWFMRGTTVTQSVILGSVSPSWVVAGADMHGDIFWRNTSTREVGLWVMNGSQVAKSVDFGPLALTWTIAGIGDFDANGSFDILWRDTGGNIAVWLMNGTTIASSSVLGAVPANWTVAQTGDYNGDGKSDVLWTDTLGNVAAWIMNGTRISSVPAYGNAGTNWTVQSLNSN